MAKKPAETVSETDITETVETLPGKATVVYSESALQVGSDEDFVRADNGVVLKVKRRVLIPSLDFKSGQTLVVRILTAFEMGKQVIEVKPGKAKMEPGFFARVASLSNMQRILWAPSVLHRTLIEEYPNDTYVGGWFHITHLGKKVSKEGTEYNSFSVDEIEPPTEQQMIDAAPRQIAA